MLLRKRHSSEDIHCINSRINHSIRSELEKEQLIKELIEENKKLKEDIEVLERGD